MCRIDLCGQIGVKISSYGDRKFIKINPLNRPWGRFLRREDTTVVYTNPLSRSVHGCINLIFIILSILFNLFICINLVYFFVFLFNYFIYLNFTYSECNASKGLSHN